MNKEKDFRVTVIRKSVYDNLQISEDYETKNIVRFPVFLYTPDMSNTTNHYHIKLSRLQAKKLRDWLTIYLKSQK